ncbi:alpha/beta-hydrolase [Clavulina sp. PMI_390]|nr:alpha/beta-hydrolase [Clavulina sp. PMI_390]
MSIASRSKRLLGRANALNTTRLNALASSSSSRLSPPSARGVIHHQRRTFASAQTQYQETGPTHWDQHHRNYSTDANETGDVVELAFEKAEPKDGAGRGKPVVVLHGLFGQKQNWRSLSRAMAKSMHTNVYAVDLRNHGTSPHNPRMDYNTMAADVRHFFKTHGLEDVVLIGHSMGGKVAATLALDPSLPSNTLSSLVIADITPLRFGLSTDFAQYLDAMQEIERQGVKDQKGAMAIMEQRGLIQHFLLTNLGGPSPGSNVRKFRIPLDIHSDNLPNAGDFPYAPGEAKYEGRTMVVRGSKSKYVPDSKLDEFRSFFPNMRLETLDAGHWVHAERPNEFLGIVRDFVKTA